jgi:hypothetical protein
MARFFQALLILSATAFCWLAMMTSHELGHVLHAWGSGGTVQHVILHPLQLSQTILGENPHPLVVAWGGPIWGCLLPLGVFGIVRCVARPYAYLAAYFAGFCLIANGAYLAGGTFAGGTLDDAGAILNHGGAWWPLILFALVAITAGFYLLNGLGPKFGLGDARGQVDRRAAVGSVVALMLLVVVELALAMRTTP